MAEGLALDEVRPQEMRQLDMGIQFEEYGWDTFRDLFDKMMQEKCCFISIHMDSSRHFNQLVNSTDTGIVMDSNNYWPVHPNTKNLERFSYRYQNNPNVDIIYSTTSELMANVNDWKKCIFGTFPTIHHEGDLTDHIVNNAIKLYKHQWDYYTLNFHMIKFIIEPQKICTNMMKIILALKHEIPSKRKFRIGQECCLIVKFNLTHSDDAIKWFKSLKEFGKRDLSSLFPAVVIGKDIPSDDLLNQWIQLKLAMIFIPTDIFITSGNYRNPPHLSLEHKNLLMKLICAGVTRIITDPKGTDSNLRECCYYIDFIYKKYCSRSVAEEFVDADDLRESISLLYINS